MKRLLVTLALLASVSPLLAQAPAADPPVATSTPSDMRITRWQQDLDHLIAELPAKHKNAFFKCPEETWRARAADLRARLPELSDTQIYAELRRLVALLGDAHTLVIAGQDAALPPRRAYPMAAIALSDGVFTPILPKEHESLIGLKLVRIGGTPIDAALVKIAELQAADNDSGRKHIVMQDLRDPDALAALGVVTDPERAEFTFADAKGSETTITLSPVTHGADVMSLIAQRPDPKSLPAWQSQRRFPYGHEFFADSKTFYIWYDTCANHPEKSVADFTAETIKALDEKLATGDTERVVIDLRRNGGGNSSLFVPFIQQLAEREPLKARGRLFGLIGRRTFSSGMMNAYQLRNATGALLIGEPTGGAPNGFGEVRSFSLPNSRLTVYYSTKLFRGVEQDTDAIYPDLTVIPWSRAYFEGRDVVLERVIKWGNR